jgi:hypothetical protein
VRESYDGRAILGEVTSAFLPGAVIGAGEIPATPSASTAGSADCRRSRRRRSAPAVKREPP